MAPAGEPPVKSGATGSSAVPPGTGPKGTEPPRPEAPAKAAATGSSAVKPDPAKDDGKTADAKSGTSGSGTSGGGDAKPGSGPQAASRIGAGAKETLTDGPILDLKAKRLSDPAETGSAGASAGPTPKVGAAPAQAASGGSGFGALAAAALLGGIVGAALFYALAASGVLGSDQSRFTALDQKIATLAPSEAVSALDKRVAANEQALKPLPEAVKSASDRANEALQKAGAAPAPAAEGAAPAQGVAQGAAPAVPSDLVARLDALDQRVSALQEEPGREQPDGSKLTESRGGSDAVRLADLDERLKALETKGGEAAPAAAAPGPGATPAPGAAPSPDLSQQLAALQGDIDARAKASESAAQALGQRFDQMQQSLDARVKSATEAIQSVTDASKTAAEAGKTQAEEAAKGVDRRLQEQADRIAALDKAVDGSAKAATVQAALRIVAAERIATALDGGTPYADALTSLRNTEGGDAGKLEALAPFAESGAPTAAGLAAAFKPIRDKVLAAQAAAKARTVAETGSVTDKLQAMASSIVQVKRTGAPPPVDAGGKPAPAEDENPTAKVQDALDQGRISAAAQAFASLPEDVRATAGEFGKVLKARADADAAAQALQAEAFKSLSGSGPTTGAGR